MSLFSSRVWWEAHPGNDEEYDTGGFCVANIDNDGSGAGTPSPPSPAHPGLDAPLSLVRRRQLMIAASGHAEKIITGSFQGFLRIFLPKQSGFQVDDLLLEAGLDQPILQLAAGKFTQCVSISPVDPFPSRSRLRVLMFVFWFVT